MATPTEREVDRLLEVMEKLLDWMPTNEDLDGRSSRCKPTVTVKVHEGDIREARALVSTYKPTRAARRAS